MITNWQLSDAEIKELIPLGTAFRNIQQEKDFCESVNIIVETFLSMRDVFDQPDDYTKIYQLHKALDIAIIKNRDVDWTDIAQQLKGLSALAISFLNNRAIAQGKPLPQPDEFRNTNDRIAAAEVLMSLIQVGLTKNENNDLQPILWTRKKREKTFKKTTEFEILIKGLASAWDSAFKESSGKNAASTRSKRDTPTKFVIFVRGLCSRLNLNGYNIENAVNRLPKSKVERISKLNW